ncbi:MAG TPA: hypothetical protein VMT24_10405, partial [Aggregatilineaceae bacterium]|nr:hypothetical protein [Aggregatilineaceae bacterium]
ELTDTMDAADVLVEAYSTMSDQTLNKEADIETQTSGERAMVTHGFQTDDGKGRGISVVLEVAPGQFALMEFQAPADAYETALPDALQIMESLQVSPAAGSGAEPCQVRAASAYVDLRVGPGTNRGIYTSMPTGSSYGVLGKKTVSDGSLWWRLDMDTGSANELWVADADVETSGSCDQVADMEAPPLIFAPPPAPAPSSENPSGTAPTPNPSKVPANGKWYFAVAPEFMVSCEGGDTERYSTADLGFQPFTAQITASPDGASLTLSDPSGTSVFYGQDGYYQTGENMGDVYLAWHLYVSSPTRMSSDITVTFLTMPCSGTFPISVQYLG